MNENLSVVDQTERQIEFSLLLQLDDTFRSYEEKLFTYIRCGEKEKAEDVLTDFCMKAVQLPKDEQLFAVRFFFTRFVTTILRQQHRKGTLPPRMLAHAYELIDEVEQWKNIAEYMLHISTFISRIQTDMTLPHLLFKGNKLLEKALTIIYDHLTEEQLTVTFLAKQLNVSPTHLTNLFKKHLQTTPAAYIAEQKINTIIFQLKETTDCLHTIRKQFGFYSHSHFIQFFKKQTGFTPLQYIQTYIY